MIQSVTADMGQSLNLYALYYVVVALCVLVTLAITKNPLALMGLLFLFFTSNVVPPPPVQYTPENRGEPCIGFTANVTDD